MERPESLLSWKDQFFISPLGQWIDQHKNTLWNVGIVLSAILIWGIIHSSRSLDVNSVRQVNEAYAAWKSKPEDGALYHDLKLSLDKTPSMRIALRSEIAQQLLSMNRCDEAEKWAKLPLQELHSIAPLHAEFAEISFLIECKKYQEVLEKSVSLKEQIRNQQTGLNSRNLIRIAMLQQQLGNVAGEMAAWKDWEEWIAAENNQTLQEQALKGLGDRSISFQSYVNERKADL